MGNYLAKIRRSTTEAENTDNLTPNFTTVENQDFGRYLVSTKNFNVGDVVWEEQPLISGPCESLDSSKADYGQYTCITCFQKLESVPVNCSRCGWPCCSDICSTNAAHKNYECKIFAKLGIRVAPANFGKLIYLRAVLSKEAEPEMYALLQNLSSEYFKLPEALVLRHKQDTTAIMEFITKDCQLNVSRNEIGRLWSIFGINAYVLTAWESNMTEFVGQLIYYYGSLIANSCSPNLGYFYFKDKGSNGVMLWKIRFYARQAIKPGDVLSHAYSPPELLYGTVPRLIRIYERHNFMCKCSRCKDKTEEGTYFQALICPKCKVGNQLPMNSDGMVGSPWDCDVCSYVMDADSVREIVDELKRGPYSLRERAVTVNTLTIADKFLEDQEGVLHKNHYLMFQCAVHWLCGINSFGNIFNPEENADEIYKKIMKRVKIYVPLCLKYSSCDYVSNLFFNIANVTEKFIMRSPAMFSDSSLHYQLQMSTRILEYLESSLFWKKLNPNTPMHERHTNLISREVSYWSMQVNEIKTQIGSL